MAFLAEALVDELLLAAEELLDLGLEVLVLVVRELGRAGDDERRAGLVDEDGVDLVDDGIVMTALDAHVAARDHVVAQVVKAKLRVGTVREVRKVRGLLHGRLHAVLQQADVQPHAAIDLAHPLAISASKVVIDGNDMHALAGQGVQVTGERRDQRLAFASLHLGDHAAVQRDTADELHVKVTLVNGAVGHLAHRGKRLRQHAVEALAVGIALAEEHGLPCEFGIIHLVRRVVRTQVVNARGDLFKFLELTICATRKQLGKQSSHMSSSARLRALRSPIHLS